MDIGKVVGIIIAVVLTLGVVLGFIFQTTQTYSNVDTGLTCTKNQWCSLSKDRIVNGTWAVTNSTGGQPYVEGVNITIDTSEGRINVSSVATTQTVTANYNYVNHNYLADAGARNVAGVLGIGVAVGLLWLIFSQAIKR